MWQKKESKLEHSWFFRQFLDSVQREMWLFFVTAGMLRKILFFLVKRLWIITPNAVIWYIAVKVWGMLTHKCELKKKMSKKYFKGKLARKNLQKSKNP